MGILDGSYGGGILDPNTASLLGFAAGVGQASGPSRLPISMGQVMGSGIQGMLSGQQAGQLAQLRQEALTGQRIQNANAALSYNLWAPYLGQQPIATSSPAGGAPITPGASPVQGMAPAQPQPGGIQVAGNPGAPLGGAPASPAGAGDMMSLLSNTPPPILQKMGIQVPPELTAAFYAGIKPGTPEYQTIVRNVAIKASGVNPVIGGERAGVPAQNYNLATGNYEPQQGAYDRIYEGARQQGLGALQAKEQEAAYKTSLETGEPAPSVGTGLLPGTTAAQAANPRPLAFKPQAAPQTQANGDFTTDRGTVVPSAFGNQKMGPGSDLINKQNTESINTEKGWAAVRPAIETQRARLGVISDSLSDLDAKGFTEARANIANRFHGLGMDGIANAVMSQGNVADVQRILWAGMQDVMQQLKVANAGSGGRILRSEFEAYMEHAFSPDQIGPSLRTAVTQQLGTMYQMGNMIDDYYGTGRQRGWRDANQYQSAYLSKNPIEGFVKYAEDTTPQFKGSPSASRGTPKLADPLGIR